MIHSLLRNIGYLLILLFILLPGLWTSIAWADPNVWPYDTPAPASESTLLGLAQNTDPHAAPLGNFFALLIKSIPGFASGGNSLLASGCAADGTDQTACINNALTLASGCVLVDPTATATGFYVAGTITIPAGHCLAGTVFTPSNSILSFAGTSHITCNNQAAAPCVVINNTGNYATQLHDITFLGTNAGDATAAPVSGSIGFQWKAGYNPVLTNIQFANFDTCAYLGPLGLGIISTKITNSFFSRCQTHYIVDDGAPELYFIGGRWGENGGTDYNSADDFVYATQSVPGGGGSGPNSIVIDSVQLNPGGKTVGCAFRWGGFNGTPSGVYNSNKIVNSHIEILDAGYTGSATQGMICIDNTVPTFPGMILANNEFYTDGGVVNHPMFNINPTITYGDDFRVTNNRIGTAPFTLTIGSSPGSHGPVFSDNYFSTGSTFTAGSTGAVLTLNNNVLGSYTINGQWGYLNLDGNKGTFTDNATGTVFESNEALRTWTPTITTSGGGESVGYTTNVGSWTRTPTGGLWLFYNIALSSFSGGSGTLRIGGFPKTCALLGMATLPNAWSGFSGLTGSPYVATVGSSAFANIMQSGVSASSNAVPTNVTNSTSLIGTVGCGTAQ